MYVCPECRSVYHNELTHCERDQERLIRVQANQNSRTYPLTGHELDGRYELLGGLGQGGVGTVYLANHVHLGQLSAVKFLDIDMLGDVDEEQREESLQDFVKEAKLAMMLRHDNVVRVMDYGVHDGCPFLVMEYVPGSSLLKRMNAGDQFSVSQCMNIVERIAEALSAFHERRLVHRDLKPANVILDPRDNGELTLVDLGLVKDLSNEARSSTHPLALRGTPGYLAPEQVPGWVLSSAGVDVEGEKQPVDARVDIYALGVLAFELLTGQPPYPKGLSPIKVIVHACTNPPPDIISLRPESREHPLFVELIRSMMARSPNDRPLDARVVLDRLEQARNPESANPLQDQVDRARQALLSYQNTPPEVAPSYPTPRPATREGPQSGAYPQITSGVHITGGLIPPPASLMRSGVHAVPDLPPPASPPSPVLSPSTLDHEATSDHTIGDGVLDSDFEVDGSSKNSFAHEATEIHDHGATPHPAPSRRNPSGNYASSYAPIASRQESGAYNRNSGVYQTPAPSVMSTSSPEVILPEQGSRKVLWVGVILVAVTVSLFAFMFRDQKPQQLYTVNSRSATQQERQQVRRAEVSRGAKRSVTRSTARSNSRSNVVISAQDQRSPEERSLGRDANTERDQLPTPRFSVLETTDEARESAQRATVREELTSKSAAVKVISSEASSSATAKRPSPQAKTRAKSKSVARRRPSNKRRVRRTQSDRAPNVGKFSDRDYRLLMHQVRSAKDRGKKRVALQRALTRLKSSDKYYREVKSLLDSL